MLCLSKKPGGSVKTGHVSRSSQNDECGKLERHITGPFRHTSTFFLSGFFATCPPRRIQTIKGRRRRKFQPGRGGRSSRMPGKISRSRVRMTSAFGRLGTQTRVTFTACLPRVKCGNDRIRRKHPANHTRSKSRGPACSSLRPSLGWRGPPVYTPVIVHPAAWCLLVLQLRNGI